MECSPNAWEMLVRYDQCARLKPSERIDAHRCKAPESARLLHGFAVDEAWVADQRGNVCMAHAKRLQTKYWARRAFTPQDCLDQLNALIDADDDLGTVAVKMQGGGMGVDGR